MPPKLSADKTLRYVLAEAWHMSERLFHKICGKQSSCNPKGGITEASYPLTTLKS